MNSILLFLVSILFIIGALVIDRAYNKYDENLNEGKPIDKAFMGETKIGFYASIVFAILFFVFFILSFLD